MQTGAALSLIGWRLRERTASLCSSAMWMPWFAAVLDLDTAGECLYGNDVVHSSETYLLLAEAHLRNGDAGQAATALNAVRERAKAQKMFSASEIDIYTILDERARELSFEERRWPTLLRMGSSLNGGSNEVMKKQILDT